MSDYIPSMTISQFKKLKVHELKELQCHEVLTDGEYLFTFINPQTDYVKMQVEFAGQVSNSVGGKKTVEELEDATVRI